MGRMGERREKADQGRYVCGGGGDKERERERGGEEEVDVVRDC